jgi:hypothetical protein
MKPLLVACALAALVITFFLVQNDGGSTAPELPPLTDVARAVDGPAAELADTTNIETTPVAPRVEVIAEKAESTPIAVTDAPPALARTTATLTVRVVDEDGAGVQRVNVALQPTPEEIPALRTGRGNGYTMVQGSTAQDGRVTLEVSAGRPLELRAVGFGETSEGTVLVDSLAVGARAEATIIVKTRNDLVLEGRVVDAANGAGLEGIELRVEHQSGFRGSREQRPYALPPASKPDAVTDVTGRFQMSVKSWQTSTALCTGAGWSPRFARLHRAASARGGDPAARAEAREIEPIEIALLRAARIEGAVMGARTPTVARVSIGGHGLSTEESSGDWYSNLYGRVYQRDADVDAHGMFTLEDLPANADLTLTLADATTGEARLRDAQPFRIAPGATHRASWTIGSGGRFECSVQHATGAPAPDEELWLLAYGDAYPGPTADRWTPLQRARTDSAGRCAFADVQPGRWVVALAPASKRGAGDASVRYAVATAIESPGASVPVSFTLHTGLYIAGTVLAPDGTPTPAYVSAGNASYRGDAQGSPVRAGKFRIGPLLPGRYRLTAHGPGSTSEGAAPLTDSDPVLAEAGSEGVELWLRAGCDFELSAIDAGTGEPTLGKFTLVPQERETAVYSGGYRTSATFGGQAPGRYRVLACTEEGLVGSLEVEAAAGERRALTIPVAPGGSVRVDYRGQARMLAVWLEESGARMGLVYVPSGGSESLSAPAGSYTLRTFVAEFDHATQTLSRLNEGTRAVEITVGGEVTIEIEH